MNSSECTHVGCQPEYMKELIQSAKDSKIEPTGWFGELAADIKSLKKTNPEFIDMFRKLASGCHIKLAEQLVDLQSTKHKRDTVALTAGCRAQQAKKKKEDTSS